MEVIHGITEGSVLFTKEGYAHVESLIAEGLKVSSGSPENPLNDVTSKSRLDSTPIVKVKFEDGFEFRVTPDLPFLTYSGDFVEAKDLAGHEVCIPQIDIFGDHSLETSEVLAKAIAKGFVFRMDTGDTTFDYKIIVKDASDSEVQKFLSPEMQGFLGSLLEEKSSAMLTKILPFLLKGLNAESAFSLLDKVYAEAMNGSLIFSDKNDALAVRTVLYALGVKSHWTDFGSYAISVKDFTQSSEAFFGLKVLSVEAEEKPEVVHTLTVDKVHRYIVNGFVVHNNSDRLKVSQNDIISEQRGELLKESMPYGNYVLSDLGLQLAGTEGVKMIMTSSKAKPLLSWKPVSQDLVMIKTLRGISVTLPFSCYVGSIKDIALSTKTAGELSVGDPVLVSLDSLDNKLHADKSVLVEESARKGEFPPYVMMITNSIKWIYLRHWFVNHGRVTELGLTLFPTNAAQIAHLHNFLNSLGVSIYQSVVEEEVCLVVDRIHEAKVMKETKLPDIYGIYLADLPQDKTYGLPKIIELEAPWYDPKLVAYDEVATVENLGPGEVILPLVSEGYFVLNSLLISNKGI